MVGSRKSEQKCAVCEEAENHQQVCGEESKKERRVFIPKQTDGKQVSGPLIGWVRYVSVVPISVTWKISAFLTTPKST